MPDPKVTLFWAPGPTKIKDTADTAAAPAMLCLSKFLMREGFETSIVDGSLLAPQHKISENIEKGLSRLLKTIERTSPDILAVGSWTTNMPYAAEITREFKARNPNVQIVLGGHNATFVPEETLGLLPHIDFLVRGEGGQTLLELCRNISEPGKLSSVLGVSFRGADCRIVHNANRPLIDDLNTLPLLDLEEVVDRPNDTSFSLLFGRGCPYKCSFCSISGMWGSVRHFSPDYIIRQMKHVHRLYGDINIRFDSDNFLCNIPWAKKVASLLHKEFPTLRWHALVRADHISRDIMGYMRSCGLNSVFVGIESVIPSTLQFYNKTADPAGYIRQVTDAIKILDEFEYYSFLSFVSGAPDETREDMLRTEQFILSLKGKPNHELFGGPLTIYPGTSLWEKYKKGELEVYQRPDNSPLLSDVAIEKKYGNLLWMSPNLYRVRNRTMPREEFESLLARVQNAIHGGG